MTPKWAPKCKTCGVAMAEHPGVYATCAELMAAKAEVKRLRAENERLKQELSYAIEQRECECSPEDACCFARERDVAKAEIDRLRRVMADLLGQFAHVGICEPVEGFVEEPECLAMCVRELIAWKQALNEIAPADAMREKPEDLSGYVVSFDEVVKSCQAYGFDNWGESPLELIGDMGERIAELQRAAVAALIAWMGCWSKQDCAALSDVLWERAAAYIDAPHPWERIGGLTDIQALEKILDALGEPDAEAAKENEE